MTLSCSCDGDYDWYYESPDDYTILQTSRRKRCESCNILINLGSICTSFVTYRPPHNDIEERIHGDEVYMANKYMCEECSDLFFSIQDLGFCINISENMRDLANEYHEVYHNS